MVATLLANAVTPGLLDRYLAQTGFSSQQADERRPPDQPANLWEPADSAHGDDFGAHGAFDGRSTAHSYQVWASQHHGAVRSRFPPRRRRNAKPRYENERAFRVPVTTCCRPHAGRHYDQHQDQHQDDAP